ncbi:hypothetical protein ACQEU5_23260 [Marinactinospora thermotolerans]|uniref:DUF8129 domain-containing protein n=1 Tax=Marinactinospora thermotolerans DSM 45154 TaxID=1122192 RepID=A0A1T4K271_9ACTN|nr:hypothetical protein [Marinactinospora thermotolerans]SJZ36395.1 hypothetical protein SAMN02745673_00117 [Marinactinospora thermotolerans DSM 45154]
MAEVNRTDLVIPDYEHLPLGTLQHRVRSLTQEQMRDLIAYEEAHGARTPVLEMLRQRLSSLEEGAVPSQGDQQNLPEAPPAPSGGSAVGEASDRPPAAAPPHGVPAQPARPKGDRRG